MELESIYQRLRLCDRSMSFLGLACYYLRFVEGFSKIVMPITMLARNGHKFSWTEAFEDIFQELKKRLTTAPILTVPQVSLGFTVYCDASKHGLGAVLMQHSRVVAYASKQLKDYETCYPTPSSSCLSVKNMATLFVWGTL